MVPPMLGSYRLCWLSTCAILFAAGVGCREGEPVADHAPPPPPPTASDPQVAPAAPPPGARLPSLFNRPDERDAEAYELLVRQTVDEGGSLAALYPPRSRADEILDRLDIAAGDEVLDIGAGTGGLEIALLERGVAFEKLYAVDIDGSALEFLDAVLKISGLEGADRVQTLVSQPDDIRLPPDPSTWRLPSTRPRSS
ncbi:MAG: methyltransferase [Myxococcota bacterium]|nr:methyltransferase [Myxococcota bacterium]